MGAGSTHVLLRFPLQLHNQRETLRQVPIILNKAEEFSSIAGTQPNSESIRRFFTGIPATENLFKVFLSGSKTRFRSAICQEVTCT